MEKMYPENPNKTYSFENFKLQSFDKFKKFAIKTSKNKQDLKILGFLYELLEKYKSSLLIYLIILEKKENFKKYHLRLNLFLWWYSIFLIKIEKFSLILLKKNFCYNQILLFTAKCQCHFGSKKYAIFFFKKILKYENITKISKNGYKRKKTSSNYFLLNFLLREQTSEKKEKKSLETFFLKLKLLRSPDKKLFYITFHNLVRFRDFFLKKKENMISLSKSFKKIKNQGLPIVLQQWKNFILNCQNYRNFNSLKVFFFYISINFKWFSAFMILFSKKKISLKMCIILFQAYRIKNLFESYNSIFRNFKFKFNFLKKIAKFLFKNLLISIGLKIYKWIYEKNSNSGESLRIITLMKKKFSSKKNASLIFRKGIKLFIKNKLSKKKKGEKRVDGFMKIVENLFEKKKIYGLSKLFLSFLSLQNERTKNLIQNRSTKKKKKLIEYIKDFSKKKKIYNSLRFLKNTIKLGGSPKTSMKNFFSFLKLKNLIFFYILFNKTLSKEKILSHVINNNFFFSSSSELLKTCYILISIKKKKYEKAYKITRSRCLSCPYCIRSWALLSKLENQIGIITSKTLRYSLRILLKHPTSLPAIIFTGNHCSVFGSFGYALAEFFQAYRWKKGSPFLNFSICLQYLKGSSSRNLKSTEFAVFLGLGFFSEYQKLRHFIIQNRMKRNFLGLGLEIELFFNTAKFYLFLGLNYLAMISLKKGISKTYSFITLTKKKRYSEKISSSELKKKILWDISILLFELENNLQ